MPSLTAVAPACPSTTICTGLALPRLKSRSRIFQPWTAYWSSGYPAADEPVLPVCMKTMGEAASRSRVTAVASQRTGRRMMLWERRSQTPSWPWARRVAMRPMSGTRRAFTRSPSRLSTAGSRMSDVSSVVMTTSITPTPMLIVMSTGTIAMPSMASTTVIPLKKMARLALAPVAAMASIFSRPRARSSR